MEAAKVQEATAMIIHTPQGSTRERVSLSQAIIQNIHEQGGPPDMWYCDTTSDVEEELAYQKVLRDGAWLWIELPTYEAATCLKAVLVRLGVYPAPDSLTRGGRMLYCFRVTPWNCRTIRNV